MSTGYSRLNNSAFPPSNLVFSFVFERDGFQMLSPSMPIARTSRSPNASYALFGGDHVGNVVFGSQMADGEFTISRSGFISYPLIGDVDHCGQTSTQLQERILANLAIEYVKDPRVALEVLPTQPLDILTKNSEPGEFPFTNGPTVGSCSSYYAN